MAVWLIRAGSHGEHEQKFIHEKRVYVTWDDLDKNLANLSDRQKLSEEMKELYPDSKPKRISNWVSQVWPFAHDMQLEDLVVLPLKSQPAIQIGKITGDYHFEPSGPNPYYHWREVEWIAESIPRSHFNQDLLYTFGALMTICRIQRNNAEQRIFAMRENGWKPETQISVIKETNQSEGEAPEGTDLEELARDQISQMISARFKGHGLTRLVEAVLKAQGYATYLSPPGSDGGADILAGSGPLGFGSPKLCVEVKSGDEPIGRPTVDKLLGAVSKFGAHEGLFVSWSGFRSTVPKELAASFFKVRLWNQKDLLDQLFTNYDHLDEELKAELQLKRVWMVAATGEE